MNEYQAEKKKKGAREDGTSETGKYGMLCLQLLKYGMLSDKAREGGKGVEKPKNKSSMKNVGQQEYPNSQLGK